MLTPSNPPMLVEASSDDRRVILLCDNHNLARAIELLIEDLPGVIVQTWELGQVKEDCRCENIPVVCSLVVVAMSSALREPFLELARSGLAGLVGRVPIVVITERHFEFHPQDLITQVSFPYEINQLKQLFLSSLTEQASARQ